MAEESGPTLFLGLSIVEWIALIGVVALGNSLCWEWGFWDALDVSFGEIPISFTDMVENLAWVPVFMVPIIGAAILVALTRRIEEFKSEDEIIKEARFPRFVKFHREAPYTVIFIMLLIVVGLQAYFIGTVQPLLFFFFVLILWGYFVPWVFGHSRAPKNAPLYFFCCYVPMFFLLSYMSGREIAGNIISENKTANVFLMTGKIVQKKQLILLRSSHDFVYAYDSENGLLLTLPWSSVVRIDAKSNPNPGIKIPIISGYGDEKTEEKKK